jgi:hypothetical protein
MKPYKTIRNLRSSHHRGMAALEVVMIIGAMLPVAIVLLVAVREALKMIHSLIANLVGSPLF